jgi:hypothetical protein
MKRWLYVLGAVLLLVMLAAIVFKTTRSLLNSAKQMSLAGQNHTPPVIKATELPQGDPDVVGLLVRRQDNSLFIGTGQIIFDRKRDPKTSSQSFSSAFAGPVVEILVTHATQIYYDVTPLPESDNPTSQIQQVVLAGNLDRLLEPAVMSVWGSKSSGRWLARTILILPPPG